VSLNAEVDAIYSGRLGIKGGIQKVQAVLPCDFLIQVRQPGGIRYIIRMISHVGYQPDRGYQENGPGGGCGHRPGQLGSKKPRPKQRRHLFAAAKA